MLGGFGADFYPRSPCGERQTTQRAGWRRNEISIHALLAESDILGREGVVQRM